MLTRKKDKFAKRSVITMSEPKSINSEQYRTIRTNIEFSSVDTEVKSLLITSAGGRRKIDYHDQSCRRICPAGEKSAFN